MGPDRQHTVRLRHQRQQDGPAETLRALQLLQEREGRPPLQPLEQQVNHTVTTQPEAPHQVIIRVHVVGHPLRRTAGEHLGRMLQQVPLQAATGNQPFEIAVAGDQHHRAGFAIRGPHGRDNRHQHQVIVVAMSAVEIEQGRRAKVHGRILYQKVHDNPSNAPLAPVSAWKESVENR